MGSPILFGGNNTSSSLQNQLLMANGSLISDNGAKNYINNGSFENGAITGWSLFQTTITSNLPTGTIDAYAGSATLSVDDTYVLSGNYSLSLQRTLGSIPAGQGFISNAFTIDTEDLAQVLAIRFSYQAFFFSSSVNWSGVLGSQSFMVYVYDVTNSAWIQPAGFLGMNQGTNAGQFQATFQTGVTSGNQYRIAVLTSVSTGSNIYLNFDNFFVGPQTAPQGAVVTDWVAYTPTVAGYGTGSGTAVGYYRRIGDSAEIAVQTTKDGSGGSGTTAVSFTLPAGLTADTAKMTGSSNLGTAALEAATYTVQGPVFISSNTLVSRQDGTADNISGADLTSGAVFRVHAMVPISGWSSNVEFSNTTDTRVVAAKYGGSTTAINSTSQTTIVCGTQQVDTHAAYNATTGVFTVPVSGVYKVSAAFNADLGGAPGGTAIAYVLSAARNGTVISVLSQYSITVNIAQNCGMSGSTLISCVAGDTLVVSGAKNNAGLATLTGSGSTSTVWVAFERISGPSVIAATETVACQYNNTAGTVLSDNSTIPFATRVFDSHGSFATSGVFTAPVSGIYNVTCNIRTNAFTPSAGTIYSIILYVGGSATNWMASITANAAVSQVVTLAGSSLIRLTAGQQIEVRSAISSGTLALNTTPGVNTMNIHRVGNYV